MANEVENIVSNMSYTNKDFIAIYTELLDLVKKLTYKWDPSISNESDPGVILTKLNALIGDKNNYNIDKNILETFPVSVTQESNARDLFAQLGYRMKWYRSATTPITIAYTGDTVENASITLPRFTMVSDVENEIVYTTIDEVAIPTDGTKTAEVSALQGIAVEYELNGSTLIKFSSLDADRRLYFTDPMVAENGIFICNDDNGSPSNNYSDWVMVDNMAVYPTNTNYKYYEFGVTHDGTPFLQFSEIADRQFKDGVYITYLKTMGLGGNIKSKFLSHFFNTVNVDFNGNTLSLTEDNTKITNSLNAVDGADKETIDEAYNNYKRTIGVFETLVSLRDYMDYINSLDIVSNSFVCDRTDDVQDSYKALMNNNGQISYYTYVEEGGSPSAPLMSAFDLKLYCLNYVGTPTNGTQYNDTFLMLNPDSALLSKVKDIIQDVKSIQHDYKDIEEDKICYLINSFPLGIRIIPHSKVTALQARGIVANVVTALFKNFNAKEVNFGEAASYDKIYSTILGADPLIKTAVLDDIVYDTHACYFVKDGDDYILKTDLIVSGDTPSVQHIGTVSSGTFTGGVSETISIGDICYDTNSHSVYKATTSGTQTASVSSDILNSFKFEIYAKSVLNGNSPLLVKDDKFDYSLTQSFTGQYENISKITTNTDIDLGSSGVEIPLKQNEGVVFYVPSYEVTEEYSTYVAIETNIHYTDTGSGAEVYGLPKDRITLGSGDKVILYWKESDDDSNYHYRSFAEGSVIEPTSEIRCYFGGSLIGGSLPVGEGVVTDYSTNSAIKTKLYQNNSVLSGSTALKVLKQIKVDLPHNSQKCYWVLNKKTPRTESDSEVMKYVLFEEGNANTDYILQNGEYFFYTNPSMTSLNILYPGTRISRSLVSGYDTLPEWSCTVANNDEFENITTEGASAIGNDIWQLIPSSFDLSCEEMQMFSVSGEGAEVSATFPSGYAGATLLNNTVAEFPGDTQITLISNGESQSLPTAIGGGSKIYGNSFLSYISSPTTPMVLDSDRQTVTFYEGDGTEVATVTGNASTPYYILSDDGYSLVGGKDIDVRRAVVSATSISYEEMSVYVYQEATMAGIDNYTSDRIPLVFSSAGSKTITFSVPSGEYVIPLTNPTADVFDSVTATVGGTSTEDIFDRADFKDKGVYYLLFSSDGTQTSIVITVAGTLSSSYTLTLGQLYKYTEDGNFDNPTTLQAMIDKVTSLDSEHKFDYTYKIPVDSLIENPLDGESFTNEHHPYNKYTICEIDVSSLNDIKVNNLRT